MQIRVSKQAVEIIFQTTGPTLHSDLSELAPDSALPQRIINALSAAGDDIVSALAAHGINTALPARDGEFVARTETPG